MVQVNIHEPICDYGIWKIFIWNVKQEYDDEFKLINELMTTFIQICCRDEGQA